MTDERDQCPQKVLEWAAAGSKAALATVIKTWGSSPRQVGAQLALSRDGDIAGSVSGGCVEAAVAEEAMAAMSDGAPRLLKFGVSDDDAFAVGLACGGEIEVLVDPIVDESRLSDIRTIVRACEARRPIGYAIDLQTFKRRIVSPEDTPEAFQADRSGILESGEFLLVRNPPKKMFVTGAAHISQALAPMAQIMGYEVIVADPRGAFVSEKRFPMLRRGVNLHDAWPADVLQEHAPDARTAIICLTHDPKIDDPVLEAAVKSQAFYIGALGSKRTHAKRVERLKLSAFSDPEIDRIHGPIGLDIDAKSPAEIALSILAEATACLRRPAWSIRRCE